MKLTVFDLDGTLCKPAPDALHCMGHLTKDEIHQIMDPVRIAQLEPRPEVIEMMSKLDPRYVIIITGRWDLLEDVTIAWLHEHKIRYADLLMRPHEHWQDDATIVKLMLAQEFSTSQDLDGITMWVDDDQKMLDGLPQHIQKVKV